MLAQRLEDDALSFPVTKRDLADFAQGPAAAVVDEAVSRFVEAVAKPVLAAPSLDAARDRLTSRLDHVEAFRRSMLEHISSIATPGVTIFDLIAKSLSSSRREVSLATAKRLEFAAARQLGDALAEMDDTSAYIAWLSQLPTSVIAEPELAKLIRLKQLANRVEGIVTSTLLGVSGDVPVASDQLLQELCGESLRVAKLHGAGARETLHTAGHVSAVPAKTLSKIRRVQRMVAARVPSDVSLVDALRAERLAEDEQEKAEHG